MDNTDVLEKIEDFAAQAHNGQKRKYTNEDYIVHPVKVMNTCRRVTEDRCILAAALLHDVVEDTFVKEKELFEFLKSIMHDDDAERTREYVMALTDVYTYDAFPQWNRRARKIKELERLVDIPAEAQTVKYADILDNSSQIKIHDPSFAVVMLKEYKIMLQKLDKGNALLHKEATEMVKSGLRR